MERPAMEAPTADWLVYADELQIAGDPRGELITLAHAADDRARDTFVHKHADALLGPAAKAYRKGAYRLAWKHCFITSAEVRITAADHGEHWVRTLLGLPAATHLSALTITGVTDDERPVDLTAAIAATTSTPWPPSLQMLALGDERATRAYSQIESEQRDEENLVAFGPLEALWHLPQLRHLRLELADATRVDFGEIDGTRLESLAIRALRTCPFDDEIPFLPALIATTWPRLESLELRLAESFYANIPRDDRPYRPIDAEMEGEPDDGNASGFDFHALVPLLQTLATSPLRRLALTSFDTAASLLAALEAAGLPATLRVLDLSDSAIRVDDVQWMRRHAALFAHLNELRLERTAIEDSSVFELSALAPAIVHSHRAGAPTYRYVVGME